MIRALVVWLSLSTLSFAQEKLPARIPASTPEERLVVSELSRARLHPKEYAAWLRTQTVYFEGTLWHLPGRAPIRTQEGAAALDELIAFLEHAQAPGPGPLRWSEGLSRSARQFVREQGPTGQTGHVGPTGSLLQGRLLSFGVYQSTFGEVIHYGNESPRWSAMELLIDDGLPSRGHRQAIFNPAFHVAGAATGLHAEYGQMTVVDLADAFQENPEAP
jgi:uncharacterized protein YkwD